MRDISCKLLSTTIIQDDIGNEIENQVKRIIPIIKVEDVYASEYYEANQQGYKPSLRLRISALNYDNEKEIKYNGIRYSVIRTSVPNLDEIILICERKVGNGN